MNTISRKIIRHRRISNFISSYLVVNALFYTECFKIAYCRRDVKGKIEKYNGCINREAHRSMG